MVEPGDNEGDEPKEVYYGVPCRPLERIGDYSLTGDDPGVFTDRITYVDHPKEFPEPCPEGADTDPSGNCCFYIFLQEGHTSSFF